MGTRLAVSVLGPPRVELDGEPVSVDRRKAIALLAYLVVMGESHPRDALVNLLWPEVDASRGRAALRRTLFALKQALPGPWLEAGREEIGLAFTAALRVDAAEFRRNLAACSKHGHPVTAVCPACAAPLAEAVALVRGEFLGGFSLKDSVNFDDWQAFQAERLRRELGGALERLARWHSAEREFEVALGHARRRLGLDPLDEGAHRQVMRLYAWLGRRTAALRQYEACRAVLEDQLGVVPQVATTALCEAIEAGLVPGPPEAAMPRPQSAPHPAPDEPPAFLEGEAPVERPPFVARDLELAQLGCHLEAALGGKGRVAFVTGDAGCGKSALVQEFTRRAQEAHPNLVVAGGNCNAQTGIGDPYLPFREILALLTGDVEARWAAGALTTHNARLLWQAFPLSLRALVEVGPDLVDTFVPGAALIGRAVAGGLPPGSLDRLAALVERPRAGGTSALSVEQRDLFDQYSRVLQALARQAPLVLVLDDLQWADLGSTSLLFHLGRQLAASRILVLGAYRPEEVALGRPDPSIGPAQRQRHPLEPVVHEFQRLYGDITVRLGRDESQAFVEALLDSEPNRLGSSFREMLHGQTRGHPLFTLELLRGLQERGDLIRDAGGRWVEGATLDWDTLPARVEAVIAERVARLAEPSRDLLAVACVEGEVFTAEVVARVRGAGEAEVVARLSGELDRVHRLVRAQDIVRLDGQRLSRYRFRHALHQRYVYLSLDPVERAYLHETVGDALEALHGGQDQALAEISGQLAWHFEEAGLLARAVRYLQRAGERALQLSAYREAVAHLSRGLALVSAQPESPERARQELALQLTLGVAWVGPKGYGPEAKNAYDRARELAEAVGETSQRGLVLGELAVYHYVRAEHRTARGLAEEALRLSQGAQDPLLVVLDRACLGFILFCLGEYAAALDQLEQVIALYDPEQHHRSLVSLRGSDAGISALAYAGCCLWCLGFPDQAVRRSREALALARELGHPFSLVDALCYAGCVFDVMRRDGAALGGHARELKDLASRKLRGWMGSATSHWGESLALGGDLAGGIAQMREGLEIQESGHERCYRTGCLCSLAEAQRRAGRPEQGLSTVAGALALVEETDERYIEAELLRVRAELLLAQGDTAGAESSLQDALRVARRQQARSWELRAATSLARLWQGQGRTAEARETLAAVYNWFTEGHDTPDLQEAAALLDELSP